MSDKPELKPCPFCGNEAEITPLKHEKTGVELEGVRCKQCGAMCLGQDNWNSRADLASPSEVYDRIQGCIRVIQEKDNLIADLAKPSEGHIEQAGECDCCRKLKGMKLYKVCPDCFKNDHQQGKP